MKLVNIAGYLGSGKTTLVIAVGRKLSAAGLKCAILVNDVGAVPVDGNVLRDKGLTVKDIGGGCICCQVVGSLLRTLELLARGQNPDLIIVEPTGIAVPSSINKTAMLLAKKIDISLGPTIVLFDTTRAEKLIKFDILKRLVSAQLRDADIIALSKADAVDEDMVEFSRNAVREINPRARIMRLSTRDGENVDEMVRSIREMTVSV